MQGERDRDEREGERWRRDGGGMGERRERWGKAKGDEGR